MATYADLNFDEGDDNTYAVTLTDAAGDPVDITGYTFYFTVKYNKNDSDDQAVFKITDSTIAAPTTGVINLEVVRADTVGKRPGIYPYDIKYKDASGDIKTILYGNYNLRQAVTDEVA